jgi:hypothetical protein
MSFFPNSLSIPPGPLIPSSINLKTISSQIAKIEEGGPDPVSSGSLLSVSKISYVNPYLNPTLKSNPLICEIINYNTGTDVTISTPSSTFNINTTGYYELSISVSIGGEFRISAAVFGVVINGTSTPIIISGTPPDYYGSDLSRSNSAGSVILSLNLGDTFEIIGYLTDNESVSTLIVLPDGNDITEVPITVVPTTVTIQKL